MTASRIVRGTKARICIYICAVLIITGVIACYNNTLSQLEEARKSSDICHQQEENLSTQLQVISDYKQRLEKSLKTEQAEHQQAKNDLENKLNEERSKYEKATSEANLRFSSLQQQLNILQTHHDDFKEECSKTQSKQLNEINDLQAKLKEVKGELKKMDSSKENLKSRFLQLQVDKENLQKQLSANTINHDDKESQINHLTLENHQLRRELDELKGKCTGYESIQAPNIIETSSSRTSQNSSYKALGIEEKSKSINQNFIKSPSKSTTSSSLNVSVGSLNGARPLLLPTVTPKSVKSDLGKPLPYLKKLPDGVVPIPEKRDLEKEETVNNRYRDTIAAAAELKKEEDNNRANEILDPQIGGGYEQFAFGDINEPKNSENNPINHKPHNLNLPGNKNYENDYKDNQNEVQGDDPEDDDGEDYADNIARLKDPAVRN